MTDADGRPRPARPPSRSGGYGLTVYLLAMALLAWYVYGAGLRLPLFSDDIYHLVWVETHSLMDSLLPAEDFASYRPLPSLLWYLWRHWVGFYSAGGFHALNLLLHIANGWLVSALALRLGVRRWVALGMVGPLFVLYPFSYQAVLWVGALNHLLGGFLVLLAVLLYDRGRREGRRWLAVSLLAGSLAPFANEAGLVVVGLVGLYEWALSGSARRALATPAVYLACPVSYLVIWAGWGTRRPAGLPLGLGRWEQFLQKSTFFAQGITFPFQFLTARPGKWWGWSVGRSVGVGVLLSAVVLGVLYFSGHRRWSAVVGGGWSVLTVLPPLVALSAAYVDTAPRLLYVPSMGVALLWGGALSGLWSVRRSGAASLARALLLPVLLFPGLLFLRRRVSLFEMVARPAVEALEVCRASPHASYLFLNLPGWVSYKGNAFPVGTEGVSFLPGYIGMSDFVWVNSGLRVDARAASFANIGRERPYWYTVWGRPLDWEPLGREIRAVDAVYVTVYEEDGIRLLEAGGVRVGGPAPRPVAGFEGGIALLSAEAAPSADGLEVTLTWEIRKEDEVGDSVFVHLYDEQGQLVAQADGLPLENIFPFWLGRAGDVIRDVRRITVPGGLTTGRYTLRVGLYDLGSGVHRAAWDEDGRPFPDGVVTALEFAVGAVRVSD